MEHISKGLERLNRGNHTAHQSNIEPATDEIGETREQKLEQLRRTLGLSSLVHTFENFKRVAGTETALEAFWAMASDNHKPMLLIYGGVGNGKTFLLEALSIELYKKGIRCPVSVWSDVMRRFKRGMRRVESGSTSYDDHFEQFRRQDRLIIDDVGMGSSGSEWEWGELEDIINYRYRERLFTVVATNKDLDELSERVASRFSDPEVGVIVLNKARDFRRRKVEADERLS